MDVTFATYGFGIAQFLGDRFDCLHNVFFKPPFAFDAARFAQCSRCEDGPGPGAEVLTAKFSSSDLAKIIIYIGRIDGIALAVIADVLKQLVPRQVLALLDNLSQPPVV